MKNIYIDIDIDIDMVILKNIDIDIDMDFLENIDIDKGILQNIDIDKILYRFEFGISNRAKPGTARGVPRASWPILLVIGWRFKHFWLI